MYDTLKRINTRPKPFGAYTAETLWNDPYTSKQMLAYHLDPEIEAASRSHAFIDRSAAWIATHFGLERDSRVCDFGCGPGLYTSRFAQHSDHVTGLDFSASSLEYARKNSPQVDYVQGNYLDFQSSERYDLITMIMCDFCALSPQQRGVLLEKFAALIAPGGSVLFDAYSLHAYAKRQEQAVYERNQLGGFWSARDYYAFVTTFKYDDTKVVLDRYTVYPEGGGEKELFNWLQYFHFETLEAEVAACGLKIAECFANVAGDPFEATGDEFAVVLQRI